MTYETYEELKQRITERARQLWEEDGRPEGRDMEYWLKAEDELAPHSVAGEEDPGMLVMTTRGCRGKAKHLSSDYRRLLPDSLPGIRFAVPGE